MDEMNNHIHSVSILTDDNPYKVLIVDDEEANRKLESQILSTPEFEVTALDNAKDALNLLRAQDFDVVLLDKLMPGMSGDELCYKIRHELNLPLLPVIMVTATTASNELEKSMKIGANDFIRKPYSTSEFVARVKTFANQKRITDQLDSAESMLFALARMVEAKDTHTGDHCSRLEHAAMVFGQELNLDAAQLLALKRGGVLHDIGKLGIPDNILLKNSALNEDEWGIMRNHTVIGERLCSELSSMKLTLPIIRSHHEKWDGTGYPDRLKGEQIPILARVFQIVDIYDALANIRPYKGVFTLEKIISIMEEEASKGWRDPHLSKVFLKLLREHPEKLNKPKINDNDSGIEIFNDITATSILKSEWR